MILTSPGGIASLITMHGPPLRAGLLPRLVPSYLLALGALAVLLFGFVGLVEMTYHLETQSEMGKDFKLFWLNMDPSTGWSWLLSTVVFAIGLGLFLGALRPVRAAWASVNAELQARGAA